MEDTIQALGHVTALSIGNTAPGTSSTEYENATSSRASSHSMPDFDEGNAEMLLKVRLSCNRADSERRQRHQSEDELKFAQKRLRARDAELAKLKAKCEQQESVIEKHSLQIQRKDSAAAHYRQEASDLRSQVCSLQEIVHKQSLQIAELQGGENAEDNRQRQFGDILAERTKTVKQGRKMVAMRTFFQHQQSLLESSIMELEDRCAEQFPKISTSSTKVLTNAAAGSYRHLNKSTPDSLSCSRRSDTRVTLEAVQRRVARSDFGQRLDLRSNDYLEARILSSPFVEPMKELLQQVTHLARNTKQNLDDSLNALHYVFNEGAKGSRCVLSSPHEDFSAQLKQLAARTTESLQRMHRQVTHALDAFVSMERSVKDQWIAEPKRALSTNVGVQHDTPPPTDPRVFELQEKVDFLQGLVAQIREDHSKRIDSLELAKEKAEVGTLLLQSKTVALHDAAFNAIHTVYKHRFRWTHRCPNNFAELRRPATSHDGDEVDERKAFLEVQYNMRLAKAVDADVLLLHEFADYFMSDRSFTVDMSTRSSQQQQPQQSKACHRVRSVVARERRVLGDAKINTAVKNVLKKECQVSEDLAEFGCEPRKEPEPPRHVRSAPQSRRCSDADPLRMEVWDKHQKNLWRTRRSSLVIRSAFEATLRLDDAQSFGSTTPREQRDFEEK